MHAAAIGGGMTSGMHLLNVGCGATVHPAWTNIDLVPAAPGVLAHDLRRGLPFSDATFDAVYSSHVLEHLTPSEGGQLLREMHRVLRTGGLIRLVVPDLEAIAREYLAALERVRRGEPGGEDDHAWMMLELLDQHVRTRPGGAMAEYLTRASLPNRDFVLRRMGCEAEIVWNGADGTLPPKGRGRRTAADVFRRLRGELAAVAVGVLAGAEARSAYRTAAFRQRGEIHQWMYDSQALRRQLEAAGFRDPAAVGPEESMIPSFAAFDLDMVGERVRKPDSLFMEAVRP